jgi:HAD superfamily hydrolase (TIGR01549 family)/HAD superfamily hydrolase (TIGR01509 family)
MFEILGLSLKPHILDEITEKFWYETYKNLKLRPYIKHTLKSIKENNIKIGIVSDLVAHIQIKKLRKLGITEHIDFIVTSEEAGVEKPHPALFLLALKKANCLPEEAVMVGDSIKKDIEGALYLNIRPVLITKKLFGRKYVCPVIRNFKELLSVLNIRKKNLSNKKVIIFDLMGTVFKESHIIKKSFYPIVKRKGIHISYSQLKDIYTKYSLGEIGQTDFWKIIPKEIEQKFLDSIKLNKRVPKVVKKLKNKGYLLGILSNIPKEWGSYLVNKFSLNKYFSIIVFSGEYGARKPNEKLYKIFLEKAKFKPQKCYLIDDKLINLREARFLLMKTIWMKKNKEKITFIPDYIIRNVDNLIKYF